jgi:hypothetical protein
MFIMQGFGSYAVWGMYSYMDVKTESGMLGYPELSWKIRTDFPFASCRSQVQAAVTIPGLLYKLVLSFEVTLVRNSDV